MDKKGALKKNNSIGNKSANSQIDVKSSTFSQDGNLQNFYTLQAENDDRDDKEM